MKEKPTYEELEKRVLELEKEATERKRLEEEKHEKEEALKESEKFNSSLLESSPIPILVVNLDTSIRYVNPSLTKLTGYSSDEVIGKKAPYPWWIEGDSRSGIVKEKKENIGQEIRKLEKLFRKKNGEEFWVEINSTTIFYKGEMRYSLTQWIDITEQKQAERKLKESEEKYRILFENALNAICIVQDGVIKFPNPKASEIIGYTAEELAEKLFIDLVHPEEREMLIDRYIRRLEGDESLPSISTLRLISKTGEELTVELSAVRIIWEGRPATLNIVRDITQQKKLVNQLQNAKKMEAIATLAGGIAHQFNNALSPITTSIDLLEMESAGDENIFNYTKPMKDSAQRMSHLTNQLLAYARGGKYLEKTISLSKLVRDTLPLLRHTIHPDISVDMDLLQDTFNIKADPTQMQMVLTAILQNSSEAIEDKGCIQISSRNMEIDNTSARKYIDLKPGPCIELRIKDDGKGMEKETRSKIFEPFYTTKFQGRGLGMAAVYGIIKNHGGYITVNSEVGKGTTVRIFLPAIEDKVDKNFKKTSV